VEFRAGSGSPQVFSLALSTMPVLDMHMENDNNKTVSIYVTRQNQYFSFTEQVTIAQGVRFVNVTETITSVDSTATFDHVKFTMPTKGQFVEGDGSTLGLIDKFYNVQGQIIFNQGIPFASNASAYGQGPLELDYNLGAQNQAQMAFSVGLYEFKPDKGLTLKSPDSDWIALGKTMLADNKENYTQPVNNPALMDVFDYQKGLADQNVSYIAVRYAEQIPRFAKDPFYSLVFINDEVAIFQVHKVP
jgi:hypothetical protein